MSDITRAEEAVARLLCKWAEYHATNWRLYLPRAREILQAQSDANDARCTSADAEMMCAGCKCWKSSAGVQAALNGDFS